MKDDMFIRWPIRIKIFAVCLLPVMALLFMAALNYRLLDSLGQSAERIMSRNYASIKASQMARQVLEENRNLVLSFIFEKNHVLLRSLDTKALGAAFEVCRQHIAESGEKNIVDAISEEFQYYGALISRMSLNGETDLTQDFMESTARLITEINSLIDLNERGMELADQDTRALASRAQRHSLFFLCATLGLIVLLSYWLSYKVAKPVRQLAQSLADSRRSGTCYPPYLPVRNDDEIGLLIDEFNNLFQRLAAYDRDNAAILAAEKMKVRYAEEAKARLVADLSHQLKTPMTSLVMSVNLLYEKKERLSEERVAVLMETARDDCRRMTNLINELLDIARLESKITPAHREKQDIAAIFEECLKPLAKQAEEKGVRLDTEVESDLPPIPLDPHHFPWVLTNLVGNALRFTEKGGRIVVTVQHRQDRFLFQCQDTGCGIDPRHLPYIFDRYTQFSEKEKLGTLGLGLAIVKEIIERHGGEILCESTPGQGTTFSFWIPDQVE